MARRPHLSARLRAQVVARAHNRCEWCQCPDHFSLDTFDIDHVLPLARLGLHLLENLAYACHHCNLRKGEAMSAMDPLTGVEAPLFNPRTDRWSDHFVRRALLALGEVHPPPEALASAM